MTPKFDQFINSIIPESVSFSVADSDKEVEELGELIYKLNDELHKFVMKNLNLSLDKYPDNYRGMKIEVDGDSDYFGKEGVINFYSQQFPEEIVRKAIPMLTYYMGEYNAELTHKPYLETSGLGVGDVWRLHVKINPVKDNPPELNMSNVNARAILCDVLNYSDDVLDGYEPLNANELLMKIEQVEDNDYQINKSTRTDEKEGNIYSFGLSRDSIISRLNQLKNMCEWAVKNHFTYISLS